MRSTQSSYTDWDASSDGAASTASPSATAAKLQQQQELEDADRAAKAYLTISQAANEKATAHGQTSSVGSH